MANGYAVYQDSNPQNLLVIFFSGNGSQNSLVAATAWKDQFFPTANVVAIEQDSYTIVTKTGTSILP